MKNLLIIKNNISDTIKKISLWSILSIIFLGTSFVPTSVHADPVTVQSILNANQTGGSVGFGGEITTVGQIVDSIGDIDQVPFGDNNPCFLNRRDGRVNEMKTNDNENYVPVTNDILEIQAQLATEDSDWLVMKDCLYDRAGNLIQSQFAAKFTHDTERAIAESMFAGNPAIVQNLNTFMQGPTNIILDDIIYNNANIENLCSPFKTPIKKALNDAIAKENGTSIDYGIRDVTCPLDDDGSGNHEGSFAIYNNSQYGSWNSFLNSPNIYKDFLNLEEDIKKVISDEERNMQASTQDGFHTLYRCAGEDGDTRRGSLNGSLNNYYRTAISGEYCEAISPASVIENAFTSVMNDNQRRSFEFGSFASVFPQSLKIRIARFPALDATSGVVSIENISEAFNQELNAIRVESAYIGAAIAEQFENNFIDIIVALAVEAINDATDGALDAGLQIETLTQCIQSNSGAIADTFNSGFAENIAVEVLENIIDIETQVAEFELYVASTTLQFDALQEQIRLARSASDINRLSNEIDLLEEAIENHPFANSARALEDYISTNVTSGSAASIEGLTESCLTAEWQTPPIQDEG